MVTELNKDDLYTINVNQTSGVEKVRPVTTVAAKQNLPGSGNTLPSSAANSGVTDGAKDADSSELEKAVEGLNNHVQSVQRELQFSVDQDSGRTVIKVMDMETQEVIRQIPSEEALSVARHLNEGAELELFSSYT